MQTIPGHFDGSTIELLDEAPISGEAYVLVTFLEGSMELAAARDQRRRTPSVAMYALDRYSEPLRRRMSSKRTEEGAPRPFTVGEIMTRKVISISPNDSVANAIHLMHQQGITSVIVEPDQSGEWGIMTMRDVLKKIVNADRSTEDTQVGEVATRPLIYVPQDMSLRECSKMMIDSNIRRAVVRHDGRPVGIVSDTDIFQVVEERGWGPEA